MQSNPFTQQPTRQQSPSNCHWGLRRREFLKLTVTLTSAIPSLALANIANTSNTTNNTSETNNTNDANHAPHNTLNPPWNTLASLSQHLLPQSQYGVSAQQIHAIHYMQQLAQRPDYQDGAFLQKGVGWLEDFSNQKHQQPFSQLSADDKEALLQQISQSKAGENWLIMVLNQLLEAMLTDPIYGGNPNGIGWKAVGHQPGFPRPTQPYSQIGYRQRKNIKQHLKGGV